MEERNEIPKNLNIQGARGLFCVMVFFFHVYVSGVNTYPLLKTYYFDSFFHLGEYGVELFFGVSGIVIIPSLIHSKSVLAFFINRLARILPPLWCSIGAVSILALIWENKRFSIFEYLVSLFPPLGIRSAIINPVAWSINYEVIFYMICVVFFISKRKKILALLVALFSTSFLYYNPRALMFVAGTAIAVYPTQRLAALRILKYPGVYLFVYLCLLSFIIRSLGDSPKALDYGNVDDPLKYQLIIIELLLTTALGALALAGIFVGNGIIGGLLRSRYAVYMGNISYSFYLWHAVVLAIAKRIMISYGLATAPYGQLILAATGLPASIILAYLSYALVEQRISRLAKTYLSSTTIIFLSRRSPSHKI